jgi:hypothetical protein
MENEDGNRAVIPRTGRSFYSIYAGTVQLGAKAKK